MIRVEQVQPGRNASTRAFLDLPFQIYGSVPVWVPPIRGEARRQLDPRRNPFFRLSAAVLRLARRKRQAMGRLGILDNTNTKRFNRSKMAFFTLFECEDDPAAAEALFAAGFEWARSRGLTGLQGRRGFTLTPTLPLKGGGLGWGSISEGSDATARIISR
jgi:hypothetical protein